MKHKYNHFLSALPLVFVGVTLLSLASPQARAQDTTAPTNIASLPTASDLFAGQDKLGPYSLTWNKLPPKESFKPSVVVDGKVVHENTYTWDAEKGTISFSEPLKPASMAHIVYSYDPASSERNNAPASAPVTVPLLRAGSTQLQMTALPGGVGSGKDQTDTQLVWGLSGAPMNLLGGKITTQALLAPDARTKDGGDAGLWDRSGLSLGYKMGSDISGLEANFSRAGREFAPTVGKTFKMGDAAAQTQSLAARYALAPWFRAEWKQTGTSLLAEDAGNTDLEVMAFRLGGVANLPSLNLTRTEDGKTDGKGVNNNKTTDRLELSAKIGPQVSLNGTAQKLETEGSGKAGEKSSEMSLQLQAQSTDKSQSASVAVTGLAKEVGVTDQEKNGVAVTLQASPSVTIVAEQKKEAVTTTAKDGDTTVATEQSSAQAKIALAPGTSLAGGVVMNSSDDSKTQSAVQATTVTAKVGEGKAVELAQLVISRAGSAEGPATLDTTDTRLALRLVPGLVLSGALVNNPVKDGKITEATRQEMGLSAKVGSLLLGSGYALTALAAQDGMQTGEFSVSLGLRFNRYTLLSGEYTDGLFWGDTEGVEATTRGLRVYTLGLTHDLGTALNFSLGGTMKQDKTPGAAPQDYQAEAKLGVKF
ncbi:MAG: hypothetical protein H7145_07865 [Akkermansiaceae bacterium]|nr:hypothetical protein [Armatimonadota bacterium]